MIYFLVPGKKNYMLTTKSGTHFTLITIMFYPQFVSEHVSGSNFTRTIYPRIPKPPVNLTMSNYEVCQCFTMSFFLKKKKGFSLSMVYVELLKLNSG